MKTSEALYAAADYIREHGWRQGGGEWGIRYRPCCMLDATFRVVEGRLYSDAFAAIRFVTDRHPADFNDFDCESADDAIAALEIAADIASAEGR